MNKAQALKALDSKVHEVMLAILTNGGSKFTEEEVNDAVHSAINTIAQNNPDVFCQPPDTAKMIITVTFSNNGDKYSCSAKDHLSAWQPGLHVAIKDAFRDAHLNPDNYEVHTEVVEVEPSTPATEEEQKEAEANDPRR